MANWKDQCKATRRFNMSNHIFRCLEIEGHEGNHRYESDGGYTHSDSGTQKLAVLKEVAEASPAEPPKSEDPIKAMATGDVTDSELEDIRRIASTFPLHVIIQAAMTKAKLSGMRLRMTLSRPPRAKGKRRG